MKMKTIRAVLTILLLCSVLGVGAIAFLWWQQGTTLERLEERIARIKTASIPLRFMVLSRGENISARFRFYDADGNEIASFERAWRGSELSIDSVMVPVEGRWLAFPSRVYTELIPPSRGTLLFDYYERDGFPLIHDSAGLEAKDRSILSELFARVRSPSFQESDREGRRSWGSVVHDIRNLSSFEVGAIYSLVVRPSGGMEIVRE